MVKPKSHLDSQADSHLNALNEHIKTKQNRKSENHVLRQFSKTVDDIPTAPKSVAMQRSQNQYKLVCFSCTFLDHMLGAVQVRCW